MLKNSGNRGKKNSLIKEDEEITRKRAIPLGSQITMRGKSADVKRAGDRPIDRKKTGPSQELRGIKNSLPRSLKKIVRSAEEKQASALAGFREGRKNAGLANRAD